MTDETTTEPITEQTEPLSDTERMLNVGIEVDTKKLGKFTVKELALEDLLTLATEIATVFEAIQGMGGSGDVSDMQFLASLIKDPQMFDAVKKLAAAATGKAPDDFVGLGISDWLRITKAFKEVTDWDEVKALFSEIVPPGSFGATEQISSENPLADLIDDFCFEYKWTRHYTLRHTYYQLKTLGLCIANRKFQERKLFADSVRYAQHANRNVYDRWQASLKPETPITKPRAASIPEGFVHTSELPDEEL